MEGHEHRKILFPGHFPEQGKEFQLILHIQMRGGLVQKDHLRLLAERPGQHDPLALPVADPVKGTVPQVGSMDQLQGLIHGSLVLL